MSTSLHALARHGQSVWVDYLSRSTLRTGELQGYVDSGVTGVTSNPTIFAGAITGGDDYDDQLADLGNAEPKEAFLTLAERDITQACELLRPAFDAGAGHEGWVSFEVDPHLAYRTQDTIGEAVRLHNMIDRPNLFVKIPGTERGLPATEEAVARGIPVNVTLLFSLDRHRAAADAYIRDLFDGIAAKRNALVAGRP